MSSRYLNEAEKCPECGKGRLQLTLASETLETDNGPVTIDGLLAGQCPECGAVSYASEELERLKRLLRMKTKRAITA